MTSNQRYPGEVIIPMPAIEQLDFIEKEKARLRSALQEAKRLQSAEDRGIGSSQKPKIQRVPAVLKRVKEDFDRCFEPRLVALGPFHHGKPKFERSQQVKLKLAALFADENETNDEALFNKIKAEIDDLKKSYDPEDIKDYNDDKLAWIFFVDGSAVLYAVHYGLKGDFEKLGTKADRLVFAQLDLFLLENQFPYRVLEILIGSAKVPQKWENSIAKFIDENLITNIRSGRAKRSRHKEAAAQDGNKYNSQPPHQQPTKAAAEDDSHPLRQQPTKAAAKDYSHLLQRLRDEHLKGPPVKKTSSGVIGKILVCCGNKRKNKKTFRSIKELKEAGVHVKPSKSNGLNNISFYCNVLGSLKMPRLMVDDSTASKLMNLVALEMCPDFVNGFELTSYLCFMDTLIDTAEDVKELRGAGMLHNYLGSDEEVADLFNKMSRDLVPDQEMYGEVMDYIHKYCNNRWMTNAVQAYYTHFSNPWTCLGFSAAIMGLLFSAIQAYCSLFGCEKQS